MLIRSSLAALDFNYNVGRKPKRSADGEIMYRMKVVVHFIVTDNINLILVIR